MGYSEPPSAAGRPDAEADRLGQVFTPDHVADLMVERLVERVDNWSDAIVLDPCVGSGALPRAIARAGLSFASFQSYEIDQALARESDNWLRSNLGCADKVVCNDFLLSDEKPKRGWDVAIANPPYIRQEWIDRKDFYQRLFKDRYSVSIPGTSNLYVYFLVHIVENLTHGGAFSVVVYDSWQNTIYGNWLIDYLNSQCNALRVDRLTNAPFEGRLIDATVISGRKRGSHEGNDSPLARYAEESQELPGFVDLSDEYWTKRGLRLKQASFFMAGQEEVATCGATRFAKKPNKLTSLSVLSDHSESALLVGLNDEPSPQIMRELERRLELAIDRPESNRSILNWYRERPEYWYRHPAPPVAPLLFSYYFRGRPKHVLNKDMLPYADNYYGLSPLTEVSPATCFAVLNSSIVSLHLTKRARTQGSGLRKLQLFEYREIKVPSAKQMGKVAKRGLDKLGAEIASYPELNLKLINEVDEILFREFGCIDALKPSRIQTVLSGI